MNTRRLHRYIGIILLLPFIAWSCTAVFFLVRPGYEQAYARLEATTYPLETLPEPDLLADWHEVRFTRTVLGLHMLVKDESGWKHRNMDTGEIIVAPTGNELRMLAEDAIRLNQSRYGKIETINEQTGFITTNTGVEMTLDWNNPGFSQSGRDTRWINRIYSIHYLEWTGIQPLDKVLGVGGLFLLMYMTWTGVKLAFFGSARNNRSAGSLHNNRKDMT